MHPSEHSDCDVSQRTARRERLEFISTVLVGAREIVGLHAI